MSDLSRILTPDWLLWLLTLELLGLAALPLTALLFRSSPDRGYGLAKPLCMLLVAFLNWWLGSIADLANYAALLWILIVSLALCGLTLWRLGIAGTPVDFKSLKSAILVEEALFLAAFLVWSMVRSINPDILYSEKPMDFMLLQVSSMTHHYPPPDAWLSGQTVNYYYLGYAIFGMMGNMAGVDPRFGYDLSNITIFALGCSAGYALSLSLTKSKLWALAGAFSVMLAGNLEGVAQVIGQIRHGNLHLRGLSLWCSTRVLNGGCSANHSITEFPIFSVLWNDLHPHLIDLPFGLLSLGLGLHALQDPPTVRAVVKARYLYLGVSSLILGMLYAINSWD